MTPVTPNDGPYYDDLHVGYVFPQLPPVTISEADNLAYRMITGSEHRPSVDATLYQAISGSSGKLVSPGLALQYSIGQSTSATRRAIANLFYRGVLLKRQVEVGERIETTTTVLGLADSSPKGDLNRGKVLLGIESVGDNGPIASYQRCALLPARGGPSGHNDDLGSATSEPAPDYVGAVPSGWDLSHLAETNWEVGEERHDAMWDHIDMAPALARMTFNQAMVHRAVAYTAYPTRLVYGGHVIALAEASLTRLLPGFATLVGWGQCNHTGPAFEGDTLSFRHELTSDVPVDAGRLLTFHTRGFREIGETLGDTESIEILDWVSVIYHR
ncbi:MAG: hypothetical protein R2706_16905 [Acidimicrobiales bacterium]